MILYIMPAYNGDYYNVLLTTCACEIGDCSLVVEKPDGRMSNWPRADSALTGGQIKLQALCGKNESFVMDFLSVGLSNKVKVSTLQELSEYSYVTQLNELIRYCVLAYSYSLHAYVCKSEHA